jgi:hypothetical protein
MRAVSLNQSLRVAVTTSLMLLIAVVIGLGAAIRRGQIVPPTLDVELGIVRIVGHTTHYRDCPPYRQCPPQSVAPPQAFYVVWIIYKLAPAEQPYGKTARQVLVMPLNPRASARE